MAYTTIATPNVSDDLSIANFGTPVINNFASLRADTCGLYRTAAQSIPDTTLTAVLWDGENWDPSGMHSLASNTDRINILRSGIYLITATVRFFANATGARSCYIYRSNIAALWGENVINSGASYDTFFSPSTVCNLSSGDYITINISQTSSGSLNIQRDGARVPNFTATLLYDLTV